MAGAPLITTTTATPSSTPTPTPSPTPTPTAYPAVRPLTTVWVPPSGCPSYVPLRDPATFTYPLTPLCDPPGFVDIYNSGGYYSPGVCPISYFTNCVHFTPFGNGAVSDQGDLETTAWCVPNGWNQGVCGSRADQLVPAASYATVPGVHSFDGPVFIDAAAIQIRWKGNDLSTLQTVLPTVSPMTTFSTVTTGTPLPGVTTSIAPDAAAAQQPPSLSSGAVAGIAVGGTLGLVAFAVLAALCCARRGAWWFRARGGGRDAAGQHGAPREGGPPQHQHQYYAPGHGGGGVAELDPKFVVAQLAAVGEHPPMSPATPSTLVPVGRHELEGDAGAMARRAQQHRSSELSAASPFSSPDLHTARPVSSVAWSASKTNSMATAGTSSVVGDMAGGARAVEEINRDRHRLLAELEQIDQTRHVLTQELGRLNA